MATALAWCRSLSLNSATKKPVSISVPVLLTQPLHNGTFASSLHRLRLAQTAPLPNIAGIDFSHAGSVRHKFGHICRDGTAHNFGLADMQLPCGLLQQGL